MAIKIKILALLCAAWLAPASGFAFGAGDSSPATPGPADPVRLAIVLPVVNCARLARADISSMVGAPTHITSAAQAFDSRQVPYCKVLGYVEPHVRFEVHLPVSNWTQRFVQTGCGGMCGMLGIRLGNAQGCSPAEHGELALGTTDMGHDGGAAGKFGESDYQLRVDFAYRGVHVSTLAAKALIQRYYGRAPRYSYFAGCSDGGREALMEAERYPADFDGITAGAPAMNFVTQDTFYHGWNALVNTAPDGKAILTADKLPILHRAALAECDARDGLADGIISDPFSCHFDPAVTLCKAGQGRASCLTPEQVETARQIYAGPHDKHGDRLAISGPFPGSELVWAGVFVPRSSDARTMSAAVATGTLRYLAYRRDPPANYSLSSLKFDRRSFAATTKLHFLYDATDPDLSAFARTGGKLILWHGLADPHISPLNTIAYYTAMQKIMGPAQVDRFARLYLFPGGYHCGGGEGPFTVDLLSAIMGWVERGTAPYRLIASHISPTGMGPATPAPALPARGRTLKMASLFDSKAGSIELAKPALSGTPRKPVVDRTRPVFPYPLVAKYSGSGSINDASNFRAAEAQPVEASALRWLGSRFYSPHYEQWCTGKGASLDCHHQPQPPAN